ncbi:MAG: 16S rRNA (guanine(966)-N(2))-methyltransferase RsmD [Rickettsiales bacterium]|nr:16S rRNA (guanine(966)-N(2))-methyltransferase RsmD [Rickettsiales bacterium]
MRIISGEFKGRKLETFKDNQIRPTTNKIREKLFNILEHNSDVMFYESLSDIECMVDICCGMGSISFEAVSRGVKKAILIDKNRYLEELINYNAEKFNITDRVKFSNYNALNLPLANQESSLVFIDPPYNKNISSKILIELRKKNWLKNNALIIIELAKKTDFQPPKNFTEISRREDGITKLIFLKYQY